MTEVLDDDPLDAAVRLLVAAARTDVPGVDAEVPLLCSRAAAALASVVASASIDTPVPTDRAGLAETLDRVLAALRSPLLPLSGAVLDAWSDATEARLALALSGRV